MSKFFSAMIAASKGKKLAAGSISVIVIFVIIYILFGKFTDNRRTPEKTNTKSVAICGR